MSSANNGESPTHKLLVKGLITYMGQQGYTITNAECDGYPPCPEIEGRKPDIIGKNSAGLIAVGEAKTKTDLDLDIEQANGQFTIFADLAVASGPLKGKVAPFYIGIQKVSIQKVQGMLSSLGLTNRPSVQIIYFEI